MLTQIQGFGTTSLDELFVSSAELDQLIDDADNCSHPMGAVYTSTVQILRYAFWLGKQKAELTKLEFKQLLKKIGWHGEEKPYLKVYEAFKSFLPHQLAQVEPRTIFQIAGNLKKYQWVITQIANLAQITQDLVRGFMQQCRKPRVAKATETEEEQPNVWRRAEGGGRVFQAPPIYDEVTGVIIKEIVDAEGKTIQSVLAEAVLALKEKKDGLLVYKSQVGNLENIETEILTEEQPSEESTIQDLPASSESLTTTPDEELSNYLEVDDTALYDDAAPVDEIWYDDGELVIEDPWCYESEVEKYDEIGDYELLDVIPAQQKETPVNLLIKAYRSASCWEDIKEILSSYSEFEQQAWLALTPLERRRVIEIMQN